MYPDLSYLLHDLLGTQPDNWTSIFKTFGLLMALAFLGAAWILYIELKRKESAGILSPKKEKVKTEGPLPLSYIILQSFLGFVLGYKIWHIVLNFPSFQNDAAGMIFSTVGSPQGGLLGLLIFGGYAISQYWKRKDLKEKYETVEIYPHQRVGDITVYAAIFGLLGAKLFSVLENFNDFIQDPINQFFSGSGLTIYGGLILAFIAIYIYLKKKDIPPIHVMDAVAPALIHGYAIGRMGCQLSGDGDWGIVNAMAKPDWFIFPDWMWAYDYPHNVLNEGVPIEGCEFNYCSRLEQPVFPTPIYETIASLIIFGILWVLRKRIEIAGMIFFLYVFLNGVERFFIEFIRVNPHYELLGVNLSQAQFIALLLVATGIAGMFWLWRRSRDSA